MNTHARVEEPLSPVYSVQCVCHINDSVCSKRQAKHPSIIFYKGKVFEAIVTYQWHITMFLEMENWENMSEFYILQAWNLVDWLNDLNERVRIKGSIVLLTI
jgi:hypothetical protein